MVITTELAYARVRELQDLSRSAGTGPRLRSRRRLANHVRRLTQAPP